MSTAEVLARADAVQAEIERYLANQVGDGLDIGKAARDVEAYFDQDQDADGTEGPPGVAADIINFLNDE